jgi:hypothetical protein
VPWIDIRTAEKLINYYYWEINTEVIGVAELAL